MSTGKRFFFTAMTLLSFFMFQSNLSAQEDADPLSNITVSKEDIVKSLDMLKKQGKISEADYQKAKAELMSMSDSQVNGIKESAVDIVKKDPKKAMEMVNPKK